MLPLAFCGNDCNVCPRFTATVSGDLEQLRAVAELWHKLGYQDSVVGAKEIACHGCRSQTYCRYGIHSCAIRKKVLHCGRCADYPCGKIAEAFRTTESFASHTRTLGYELRDRIREAFFFKKERLESDRDI